jgi:UDP-glucose 4-epimerase
LYINRIIGRFFKTEKFSTLLKILILGSEGFVGNNLVDGLSKNHEVFCADMVDKSSHKNYVKFNVTDSESVMNTVKDVDVVIDLVAHSLVSSIDGPTKNAEVNIIGLLNILEACRNNKIKKLIFTSASSLVGEPQTFHVDENHIALPKTAYGITKLTSEHYLRLYFELYGLNYVIFRFFNIYGPHQKNGLIPILYNRIINDQTLTIFGKGDQVRDYVFIEDIVSFFEKSCISEIGKNSTFNMGTGNGTTIKEIIDMLSKILKIEPEIEFKPPRPGEIGNFVADTNHLKSTFENIPNTSVKDGLEKTINWLKHN